jgi:Tfp pilus assembly protein PilX
MRTVRRGATLIVALVTLLIVMLFSATLMRTLIASHRRTRLFQHHLQAQWLAEAAVQRARVQLAVDSDYSGETWRPAMPGAGSESGVAVIRLEKVDGQGSSQRIVVNAHFPDHPTRRASARRELRLERSNLSTNLSATTSETAP